MRLRNLSGENTTKSINNKVKLHRINLIVSSHKHFNHQYNKHHKHHVLRSFRKSCSSLRPRILPLLGLGIHTQPASRKLPKIFTHVFSHSIFSDLEFTFNEHLITISPRPGILPSLKSGIHN